MATIPTNPLRAMALALATALPGQCPLQVVPSGTGLPGVDYAVTAIDTWDPDGPGPQGARLVLGGQFSVAGDVAAASVATFDPATDRWEALGAYGLQVHALAVTPGQVVLAAGPSFGGRSSLSEWNGAAWVPFAGGPTPSGNGECVALAANGEPVLVTREFVSGAIRYEVHRFVAGAWQSLGAASGTSFREIYTLRVLANGDIVVGGLFDAIGGVAAQNLARFDGSTWAPIGGGVAGSVAALGELQNGDLVIGGAFSMVGGVAAANVARFDGTAWHAMGAGTAPGGGTGSGSVRAFLTLANGDLVAGGSFALAGGATVHKVARWDGAAWSPLGGGILADPATGSASPWAVWALDELPSGDVVAGGLFPRAEDRDVNSVARFDGTAWGPLVDRGIGQPGRAVAYAANGDLLLGGAFRDLDGLAVGGIGRHDGSGWSALGTGLDLAVPGEAATAEAIVVQGPDIYVGGDFDAAGGVPVDGVARYDGAAWHALGAGLTPLPGGRVRVTALAAHGQNGLVVGGEFGTAGGVPSANVALWDGSQWTALGGGLPGAGPITAAASLANGDLVVLERDLSFVSATVHLWNGTAWQVLGRTSTPGLGSVADAFALLPLPDGSLLLGGEFADIGGSGSARLARFANGSWQAPPGGSPSVNVRSIALLPGGDLLVSGYPVSGGTGFVERWSGAGWQPQSGPQCSALAVSDRGEVAMAGAFSLVNGLASASLTRSRSTCPAQVVVSGVGCVGSGGPNRLVPIAQAWVGARFEAIASGLQPNSIALSVFGLGTLSTPLPTLLPQATPGCDLLVTADEWSAILTGGGAATTSLAIPSDPTLVGLVVHHQVLGLEFRRGRFLTLTASDRLTLTIGSF